MVTRQFSHHYHAFELLSLPMSSRQRYLIKQTNLLDFHPYGSYHLNSVSNDPGLVYVIVRSNVYQN